MPTDTTAMKPILFVAIFLPAAVRAATLVTDTWVINTPVPDNDPVGLSSTRQIITTITSISEVKVNLDLSGGWAGDLYCYLAHGSGFAVLLNRPGRTAARSDGSAADDLLAVLADSGAGDIHTAIPASGAAAGIFQPDGRDIDPANSLDTSPRTAFLSSFDGLDANGDWTLFVADVAWGETMTVNTWSLTITGVPEPAAALLAAAGACLALRRRRNR